MSGSSDQRQSPHQLPPLQPPQRILMPAVVPISTESQPSDSLRSASPSDSSYAGLGRSRTPPPASQREGARDRRISAACTACKKRKSKCTGGPPPCKLCQIAGIDCVINESLDGRRKLAAKRLQDELQQHKTLLDGIFIALRTPEHTEKIIELVRSRVPISILSDYVMKSAAAANLRETRTRVPIELLIEAEEELTRQATAGEHRVSAEWAAGVEPRMPDESTASSRDSNTVPPPLSTPTQHLKTIASYPGGEDDFNRYRGFVQTLHDCPETEALYHMNALRGVGDIPSFLQGFENGSTMRDTSNSPGGMS